MKRTYLDQKLKKVTINLVTAGITLLFFVTPGLAATFTKIEMFPKHVGVFTTVKKQQFLAFGYTADGSSENITHQVEWVSDNESIVQIDESGLAVLTDAGIADVIAGRQHGAVNISCSYPKTKSITGPNMLLLRNLPTAGKL